MHIYINIDYLYYHSYFVFDHFRQVDVDFNLKWHVALWRDDDSQ